MSAAPVKLPLAVKKALRDYEPKVTAQLAEISDIVGSPVKYDIAYESLYGQLAESDRKDQIPMALIEYYFPSLIATLKRDLSDELVKKAFLSQFTSGTITFSLVDEKYTLPENTLATWNLYNGVRIIDGKLDVYTKVDRFFANVGYLEHECKLVDLLDSVPSQIPLKVAVLIRNETDKREKVLDRMAKATGVDKVTWDHEADYVDFTQTMPDRVKDSAQALLQYMEALATCLERECKDDMVKEAIVDAFGAKKVRIRCVKDMKAVPGLKMDNQYTGVQFNEGVITAMTEPSRWYANLSYLERHELVNLF